MKQASREIGFRRLALFLLGAGSNGRFMVPTFLRYGMDGTGGTGGLIRFNPTNIGSFFVILAQLFSLASAEIPRFVGRNTAQRMAFRAGHLIAPFFISVLPPGCQPIVMLVSGLRQHTLKKGLAGHQGFGFFDFPFGLSQLCVRSEGPCVAHVLFDATSVHAVRVLRVQSVVLESLVPDRRGEYF